MLAEATGCIRVFKAAIDLRLKGFDRCCAGLLAEPGRPETERLDEARRLARAYGFSDRFGFSSCLTRSVALCRHLRRRNIAATIRIGVPLTGSEFSAHAWVEVAGNAITPVAEAPQKGLDQRLHV